MRSSKTLINTKNPLFSGGFFICHIEYIKKKGIKPFQLNPSLKMVSQETSKLCFEMLEMNSASQNHLPCWGLKNVSKVAVLLKLQLETG